MRNRLLIILMLLVASLSVQAQSTSMSAQDRERWLTEIRGYKHEFLARELNLSREQQNRFFPLYDEMEDKIEALNNETRELEAKVSGDADAGDVEVTAAARSLFGLKSAEGDIEMEYFERFKDILTPRQLLQLKNAERRFTQQLLQSHHRRRNAPR